MSVISVATARPLTIVSISKESTARITWIGPRADGAWAGAGNHRSWIVTCGKIHKCLNSLPRSDDTGFKHGSFSPAASVDGLVFFLVVVLISRDFLVEFELVYKPLHLCYADVAADNQPEGGVLQQKVSR